MKQPWPSSDKCGLPLLGRKSWRMVRLGDVVNQSSESERNPVKAGLNRVVGLEHIDSDDLHIKRWDDIGEGTSFSKRFRKGQVLFGRRRAYLRKIAFAEFDGICSGDITVLESKGDGLLPELLPFLVQTDGFYEHTQKVSAGGLSPRAKWRDLATYEFALPPIPEQRRIAEILWAAEAQTRGLAVSEESLTVARSSFLDARVAEFERCGPTLPLDEVVDPQRPLCYGVVQPGPPHRSGIPFVRVCDMETGTIDSRGLQRISPEVHQQYRRSTITAGDVLVSLVGTIGRCVLVTSEAEGANIARAVARLSAAKKILPPFLRAVLESDSLQTRMRVAAFETARKTLNLSSLAQLRVPVPPLSEQRAFVNVLLLHETTAGRHRRLLDLSNQLLRTLLAKLLRQ
jgi:type I restriction enzyme S subunit